MKQVFPNTTDANHFGPRQPKSGAKKKNMPLLKFTMYFKWIYAWFSIFLISTDFIRSSFIIYEIIGQSVLDENSLGVLKGRKYPTNFLKSHDTLMQASNKYNSQSVFLNLFTVQFRDSDYNYYKKFQPNEEWGNEDFFGYFRSYTHHENGTLRTSVIKDNGNSYEALNYEPSFQFATHRISHKIAFYCLDYAAYHTKATDIKGRGKKINHFGSGSYWYIGESVNVELYRTEFYEDNSGFISNTSGINGLLYEADFVVGFDSSNYVAEMIRGFAYLLVMMFTYIYVKSGVLRSPDSYAESMFGHYELILGNKTIAIFMGVAFFTDLSLTAAIIEQLGFYAFFTWRLYYVYLLLMYSFRFVWGINFISSFWSIFATYFGQKIFFIPVSVYNLRTYQVRVLAAVSAFSCGLFQTLTMKYTKYIYLEDISLQSLVTETKKNFDIFDKSMKLSIVYFILLLSLSIGASVFQSFRMHICYKLWRVPCPHSNKLYLEFYRQGLLTALPSTYFKNFKNELSVSESFLKKLKQDPTFSVLQYSSAVNLVFFGSISKIIHMNLES